MRGARCRIARRKEINHRSSRRATCPPPSQTRSRFALRYSSPISRGSHSSSRLFYRRPSSDARTIHQPHHHQCHLRHRQ
ncbi:hypothetical protein PENTCL1PPCAC_1290, partial [Pristionchus entomophagus]